MKILFIIWNILVRLISGFIPNKNFRRNLRKNCIVTSFCPNGVKLIISDGVGRKQCKFVPFGLSIESYGYNNQIIIDNSVDLKKVSIVIRGNNNTCLIGDRTTIINAKIFLYGNDTKIIIGKDCMFSYDVELWSGDGHAIFNKGEINPYNYGQDIVIGNHVWIGAHSRILKGTNIKDNSVVGMQALVRGDFSQVNSIIAGSPATVIKNNIEWDRKEPEKFERHLHMV